MIFRYQLFSCFYWTNFLKQQLEHYNICDLYLINLNIVFLISIIKWKSKSDKTDNITMKRCQNTRVHKTLHDTKKKKKITLPTKAKLKKH